jgi:hypothetical protein
MAEVRSEILFTKIRIAYGLAWKMILEHDQSETSYTLCHAVNDMSIFTDVKPQLYRISIMIKIDIQQMMGDDINILHENINYASFMYFRNIEFDKDKGIFKIVFIY